MHELAVMKSIVATCCKYAAGARVSRVTLEIGTLTCISPDALCFCYDIATAGTPLEGSELEIIRIRAFSQCLDCGHSVEMDDILFRCDCGSMHLARPRGGDKIVIKSMQIHEDVQEIS